MWPVGEADAKTAKGSRRPMAVTSWAIRRADGHIVSVKNGQAGICERVDSFPDVDGALNMVV